MDNVDINLLLKLFKKRTSCRDYTDQDVPDEMIEKCLEAARWAPSACNKQPWRFVIVKDAGLRQAICSVCLRPIVSMPWLQTAPVIVAICAERSIVTHKIAPLISGVNYHLIDIGIAGEHFVLAAEAQGLGTCWIGWFKQKPVKKILRIPKKFKVLSLLSLGFPATVTEPSDRMALNEISSVNSWL